MVKPALILLLFWKLAKMHKKRFTILGIIAVFLVLLIAASGILKISPFLFQLLFNKGVEVKETDGNINMLLLGIAGGDHAGSDLTDTIIFASINPEKNKISLISIPRDLWIPEMQRKINTAYAIGENKNKERGLTLTKDIVSKILKQNVNYGIRVDFNGFVKAVDEIEGFTILVDNTLDDYEYPVDGKENDTCGNNEEDLIKLASASSQLEAFPCRYEHLHFDKGLNHMDGKTALAFARSRHAQGEEGTDFARSKRQEKIISAFKDKILTPQTILNPAKLLSLYYLLEDSVDTDIAESEFDDFVRLAQKMKNAKIQSFVLDYGDPKKNRPGLLVNPLTDKNYQYQWVLIPRMGNGNFSEIQKYVDCEIKIGNCQINQTDNR